MNVEKSERKERELLTGVGEVKVLAVSPTADQLVKIMGWTPKEDQKEIEYLGEKEVAIFGSEETKSFPKVDITFWVEEVKTGAKYPVRFTLVNCERTSKSGKSAYINQLGLHTFVDDEANLQDWFTKFENKKTGETSPKEYRKALIGEENLAMFLQSWLDFNKFDNKNNILLDTKKLFKGNFSELNELLDNFGDNTVIVAFTVKTKDVTNEETQETETKSYQSINNKFFCPGRFMKSFRAYQKVDFKGLNKDNYDLMNFVKNTKDAEHGIKDFFVLEEVRPYDASQDIVSSEKVLDSSSSDY